MHGLYMIHSSIVKYKKEEKTSLAIVFGWNTTNCLKRLLTQSSIALHQIDQCHESKSFTKTLNRLKIFGIVHINTKNPSYFDILHMRQGLYLRNSTKTQYPSTYIFLKILQNDLKFLPFDSCESEFQKIGPLGKLF